MIFSTGDWNPLGSKFYQKFELCPMSWGEDGINLDNFKIACAPFGGFIALYKNEKKSKSKSVPLVVSNDSRLPVYVYNSFGIIESTLQVKAFNIITMDWSHNEELIFVQEDGKVSIYNILDGNFDSFLIYKNLIETKIRDCKVLRGKDFTHLIILTDTQKFFMANIKDKKIQEYRDIYKKDLPPSCWNAFACDSSQVTIIYARDSCLYKLTLNHNEIIPFQRTNTPEMNNPIILDITISLDNKHIALYLNNGFIWIGCFEDTLKRICEFMTKCITKPEYFFWCGEQEVCCFWVDILLLIDFEKNWLDYILEGPVYLTPEVDGIRIIRNGVNEMIQKVPNVVYEIFKIGSVSPGALLLEAIKEFERMTYKSNEYMHILAERNSIELAIIQCVEAAGHQFLVSSQKLLLRAASFGKLFVPKMDPEPFVSMCRSIRILNAVRHHTIGLPITFPQFQFLSINFLIDRLVLRKKYCLAIKIAKYLESNEEVIRILKNWSFVKLKSSHLSDEEVAQIISHKINHSSGVSFSEIADRAIEENRTHLAILLLNNEIKASKQVFLFLKLEQYEQALKKATQSGDPELIFKVIEEYIQKYQKTNHKEFISILKKYDDAYCLYKKYCRHENLEKLHEILKASEDNISRGYLKIDESYSQKDLNQHRKNLREAQEFFRKAKNEFLVNSIEDQLKLLENQLKLEETLKQKFIHLSLQQTIEKLLKDGDVKLAEGLRKDFHVPDKRFWWLKINIYAEQKEWIELEKFSKTKKSPIGYEAFVQVCLKHGNKEEAQKYLHKVREEYKLSYYIKCGLLEEAVNIALLSKNLEALDFVFNKCGPNDADLKKKILTMREQM